MAYCHHTQLSVARLDLLPPNGWELERFFQTNTGEEVTQMITEAIRQYRIMMEELQYLENTLPNLIGDVKSIQQKVDKRHKRCNIATIFGCGTSIVGGAMILGGIIASPFTFGATIGLTVAGTVLTAAGSGTTAGVKSADFALGKFDLKKTNKMMDKCRGHYQRAKKAYEALKQICRKFIPMLPVPELVPMLPAPELIPMLPAPELVPMLPAPESQTAKSKVYAHAISRGYNKIRELFNEYPLGEAWLSLSACSKQLCAVLTIHMARVSQEELYAIIELTLAHGTVFTSIFKIGSILLTLWGIISDACLLISAGIELYTDKKCKVSQEISKHIEELEELWVKLKELKLAEIVKPVIG